MLSLGTKSGILVFIGLFSSISGAVVPTECAKAWSDFQPKFINLKSVVACGSQYSPKECRENLGLTASGIALGAAAGTKAARTITNKRIEPCRVAAMNLDHFPWSVILPAAWAQAQCDLQKEKLRRSIMDEAANSAEIRRREIANKLLEKLKAQEPELDKLARRAFNEFITDRRDAGSTQRKNAETEFFNLLKEKTGIKLSLNAHGGYSLESGDPLVRAKFAALMSQYMPESHARANQYEALVKIFFDGSSASYNDSSLREIDNMITQRKESLRLIKELETGNLKTEADLATYLGRLQKSAHPALSNRIATIFTRAGEAFPLSKSAFEKQVGVLLSKYKSFVTNPLEVSWLKKAAGPAIAALFSGAAMASDCVGQKQDQCRSAKQDFVESLAPVFVSQTGCSEVYSSFDSVDENCKSISGLTANIKSYLMADEETQINEFCRSTHLRDTLMKLHEDLFPSKMLGQCGDGKVQLVDDATKTHATFEFVGDALQKVSVRGRVEDSFGYTLSFDDNQAGPTGGVIQQSVNRLTTPYLVKSRDPRVLKTQSAILEDLSARLPKAFETLKCCQGVMLGQSCAHLKKDSQSQGGSSAPSGGTR